MQLARTSEREAIRQVWSGGSVRALRLRQPRMVLHRQRRLHSIRGVRRECRESARCDGWPEVSGQQMAGENLFGIFEAGILVHGISLAVTVLREQRGAAGWA